MLNYLILHAVGTLPYTYIVQQRKFNIPTIPKPFKIQYWLGNSEAHFATVHVGASRQDILL